MNKIRTAIIRNGVLYKLNDEENADNFDLTTVDSIEQQWSNQNDEPLFRELVWKHTTTEVFLNECLKRKADLRNPTVGRQRFFSEIRLGMVSRGFNFDESYLYRKFRNLKTHFLYVKNNNKKKKTNRIMWPYFNIMAEILTSERKKRVISSLRNSALTSNKNYRASPNRQESRTRKIRYTNPNNLESLRNELLAFEERRTVAIEAIATELKEANRLSRVKFELDKKKFDERNASKNDNDI